METMDREMIEWIKAHSTDDTDRLRLRYHGDKTIADAITQIECRRRAARKLHATLSADAFYFPTPLSAEQCTSDDIARFHASLIGTGEKVLDLTAGLGIDAFHAADVAAHVTAVELDPRVATALDHNAKALGIGNITAINADCREYISASSEQFDTIFIDPARRGDRGRRLFALADCLPDVTSIAGVIKSRCNRLIVKASPMLDITQCLRELPDITAVYAIGTPTECKELVLVCEFGISRAVTRHAVTVRGTEITDFEFTAEEESSASCRYGTPATGGYLYEPSPAAMKAGGTRIIAQRFGLEKLHPNTHLYYSTEMRPEFPGECRIIADIVPFNKTGCRSMAMKYPKASVTTRNFLTDAPTLAKRLKTRDGDNVRIYGTRCGSTAEAMLIATTSQTCVP